MTRQATLLSLPRRVWKCFLPLCLALSLPKASAPGPVTEEEDFQRRPPPTPSPKDRPGEDASVGAGAGCGCYRPPSGSGGGGARLAYLVTAHNPRTIDDAANLFRAIRYPSTIIIIHIDKKVDWAGEYLNSTLRYEIEDCPCGADVYIDSIFSPEWGEWSMNDPTHWAMDVLVSHPRFRDKWDAFLNLSGDTMPVLTPDVVASLFDPTSGPLRGTNFVTSASCETGLIPTSVWEFPKGWHKRVHYTHDGEGGYTGDSVIQYVDEHGKEQRKKMTTYFGSQWMALTPDFVKYLVTSLKREDSLLSRYKQDLVESERLMADETFVATTLMNVSPFNETLPKILPGGNLAALPSMYAIRYERMDEHYPTAFGLFPIQQRYDVPESSLCDRPRTWGPYFLGVYDLSNIRRTGALFVRKVSVHLDPNIVRMLPVRDHANIPDIQWPEEVKITEKPDWAKVKERLKKLAEEKAAKKEEEAKTELMPESKGQTVSEEEDDEGDGGSGNQDGNEPEGDVSSEVKKVGSKVAANRDTNALPKRAEDEGDFDGDNIKHKGLKRQAKDLPRRREG